MAKTGRQYAQEVRELRAAGFDFPASRGYLLGSAADWSSGRKSAVTKAAQFLKRSNAAKKGHATRRERQREIERIDRGISAPVEDDGIPDQPLDEEQIQAFFEDSAGDSDEVWDDIPYFDFEEADDLADEESDNYDETPS